jgi:hypothetical protein
VPNYFSNEAGPFRGGAGAESTYSSSGPAPAVVSPYPPRRAAAVAPRRSTSRHAARSDRHRRYAYAHGRSSRHAARTRTASRKQAKLTRIAHARGKPALSKSKVAAKASGSKRQPGSVKGRPAAGKDKHRTRTAFR